MNDLSDSTRQKKRAATNSIECPINLDSALERVMGDNDFLKNMLEQFDLAVPSFLRDIREAIESRDSDFMAKTAHQLKGAAVNLSLEKIAQTASAINIMGRQSDFENVEDSFSALEQAVSEFRSFFKRYLLET